MGQTAATQTRIRDTGPEDLETEWSRLTAAGLYAEALQKQEGHYPGKVPNVEAPVDSLCDSVALQFHKPRRKSTNRQEFTGGRDGVTHSFRGQYGEPATPRHGAQLQGPVTVWERVDKWSSSLKDVHVRNRQNVFRLEKTIPEGEGHLSSNTECDFTREGCGFCETLTNRPGPHKFPPNFKTFS